MHTAYSSIWQKGVVEDTPCVSPLASSHEKFISIPHLNLILFDAFHILAKAQLRTKLDTEYAIVYFLIATN